MKALCRDEREKVNEYLPKENNEINGTRKEMRFSKRVADDDLQEPRNQQNILDSLETGRDKEEQPYTL